MVALLDLVRIDDVGWSLDRMPGVRVSNNGMFWCVDLELGVCGKWRWVQGLVEWMCRDWV